MAWFIPVEIFRTKGNTFRGITFFPFLPKRLKFLAPFVWITSARLQVERKRKNLPVFFNGTTQSRSCFRSQKKYQYHLTEIFHQLKDHNDYEIFSILSSARAWTSVILAGKRDSRLHSTRSFSENVVVAKTSYQILEV